MKDPFQDPEEQLNDILNSSVVIPKLLGYIDLKIEQYKRAGPGIIDMETVIDDLKDDREKILLMR